MNTLNDNASLHLIDLENHVAIKGRKVTDEDIKSWWSIYKQHFVRPGDLVMVGVSPRTARWLKAFAGDRIQARIGHTGPDGADDALLASVYVPDIAARFGRWVIASGDGAFTGLAKQGGQRGVRVQLVTTGDSWVSPKLAAAASLHSRIRLAPRLQQQRTLASIRTVHAASAAA